MSKRAINPKPWSSLKNQSNAVTLSIRALTNRLREEQIEALRQRKYAPLTAEPPSEPAMPAQAEPEVRENNESSSLAKAGFSADPSGQNDIPKDGLRFQNRDARWQVPCGIVERFGLSAFNETFSETAMIPTNSNSDVQDKPREKVEPAYPTEDPEPITIELQSHK